MNKSQIIQEAKKVLKIEIDSAKTLSSSFNQSFYNVVKTIFDTKGRVVVTGIGKSGHIANKISATFSSTGTPSQYFVQRFAEKTRITVYLTPSSSTNKYLNFYYIKRIQDAGSYNKNPDAPYRFLPAMTSGLAFYLSQKVAPDRTQALKLYYEDEFARALAEDGSASSSYITPKAYYPATG